MPGSRRACPPRVCLVSLGCPKNQVDSERLLGSLSGLGFRLTNEPEAADILIVNTCAFIQPAQKESVETLVSSLELKHRGRVRMVAAMGCLVSKVGEAELLRLLPDVDFVIPPGANDQLVQWVAGQAWKKPSPKNPSRSPFFKGGSNLQRVLLSGPGTAYLKIAEGCSRRCAYCLIPSLRGPLQSRPADDIVSEALGLTRTGVKELVLVAQDITRYGRDLPGSGGLNALLDRLVKLPKVKWIRLMYANPDGLNRGLIQRLARESKLCKYIDMPVQHAHPSVLRRMGRTGDAAGFLKLIAWLRRRIPGVVLRTTLLTGFPGENESRHRHLLTFIQQARFDRLGVFTYSREAGTAAAGMPGQVPAAVKKRRQREIMECQAAISRERLAQRVGNLLECLVEETSGPEHVIGRTQGDAPEVDGAIVLTGTAVPGEIVRARVTGSTDHDLTGVIL